MKTKLWAAAAAAAFLAAGPLQHVDAIPQSVIGDTSKAAIKAVLSLGTKEAYACSFFPGGGATGGIFPGGGATGGDFPGHGGGWKLEKTHLGDLINRVQRWAGRG